MTTKTRVLEPPRISWTARDAETHFEPLGNCRDVDEFEKLNRIGEGTYGTVYRARDRKTKRIVALKRVILHNEASEGVRTYACARHVEPTV